MDKHKLADELDRIAQQLGTVIRAVRGDDKVFAELNLLRERQRLTDLAKAAREEQ